MRKFKRIQREHFKLSRTVFIESQTKIIIEDYLQINRNKYAVDSIKVFDIGDTSCLLLLYNFKRLCNFQTCVHVRGVVHYHDATQCFASEIQFVYCYSETIIQCAILMFASTFVELYITMLRMSALHRRVKLSIVTLIFYSTAALSR